ncbi:hypothetical protein QJQ45_011989 [Haematococcus lacustris]|nr:hypothetical protein QJQ45_011989 [Haematococcus lacustris]
MGSNRVPQLVIRADTAQKVADDGNWHRYTAATKEAGAGDSGKPTDRVEGKVVTMDEFRTSMLSYEQPPAL